MGGFRCRRITVISTCAERGRTEAQLRPGISVTSFGLHPSSSIPVYPPFSLQSSHNMSTADVVGPRRLLGGFSMKACRKLIFDASPEQNDREEDGIQDSTDNNYIQEHVERQSRRWGFNFSTGEPLPNSRLDWVAESEERVPAYYREVCLRSPPRRNLRAVRRNIMSARRSESTEQHHSADNGFVVGGQVNNSRVIPGNNLAASSTVSARPETETASATVSTSSPSVHHNNEETREENNGILSKSSSPSTSQARKTQSHIDDFFNQRKRRCSSETKDSSAKRTKSFPDRLDRPRSAPAAVATSS